MGKFTVEVTQVYKVTRTIKVEVEAEDWESAVERLRSGDEDVPSFEDTRWTTGWNLMNEEYVGAEEDKTVKGYADELYDADPNCDHVIVNAPGGGVKCEKCSGWFCY